MRNLIICVLVTALNIFLIGCDEETSKSGDIKTVEVNPTEKSAIEKCKNTNDELNRDEEHEIEIPDKNLETVIRDKTGNLDEPITSKELEYITSLELGNKGITDLTGLEHATNLEILHLQGNDIKDLTAIYKLINIRELELSIESSNMVDKVKLINSLPNLQSLHIEGMERFDAVKDLQILGSDSIFIEGEKFIINTLGKPKEVEIDERYIVDPVGIYEKKSYIYPEVEIILLRPYTLIKGTSKFVPDIDGEFIFNEAKVYKQGVIGPRGIEVGHTLEEVLNKFPILYQDDKNKWKYSKLSVENGEVKKIEFSDYSSDSPYGFFTHHFKFIIFIKDNKVTSYELKHIIYAL